MEKTQSDNKKTIFSWAMIHNLQLIIDFHNLQHQMMKNQILRINENIVSCNDKSEKKELLLQKSNYINTYDDLLKVNTFLMMYAHLEEFLDISVILTPRFGHVDPPGVIGSKNVMR
jgi:hypothetical protein